MSSAEVAKMADTFFDRNGKPTEKSNIPINQVSAATSSATLPPPTPFTSSASSFTSVFNEDDSDVNQIRRGNFRGNDRGRSQNRGQRSQSRPGSNRFPSSSSTGYNSNNNSNGSKSTFPPGTCRWHRRFGEKSLKCCTDCPRFKTFSASQQAGNGQGGRRA